MARDLTISKEAIADFDDIWDFIAKDNPAKADLFIERLYQKCVDLSELNGIGRSRDELASDVLSIPFKRYILFFKRSDTSIKIIRILHGARDLGSTL